jgi:hypothetical protein
MVPLTTCSSAMSHHLGIAAYTTEWHIRRGIQKLGSTPCSKPDFSRAPRADRSGRSPRRARDPLPAWLVGTGRLDEHPGEDGLAIAFGG